jgi:hypothetical protein
MAAKEERIDMLRRLLEANGVILGDSDQAVQELEDWFRENLEADPDDTTRPAPIWLSVVNDVGLFLGDIIVERTPGVEWRFFDMGKRNMAYHRHVLMGFDVPHPEYNVDPDRLVSTYAFRVVNGEGKHERGTFLSILHG